MLGSQGIDEDSSVTFSSNGSILWRVSFWISLKHDFTCDSKLRILEVRSDLNSLRAKLIRSSIWILRDSERISEGD